LINLIGLAMSLRYSDHLRKNWGVNGVADIGEWGKNQGEAAWPSSRK
jgi:hypothetical protein